MTDELGYRAELANQVLVRLRRLEDSEWHQIVAAGGDASEYIALAHELGLFALEIFEEEFGPESRRLVDARLQDAAELFPAAAVTTTDDVSRQILAEGVLLATVLRATRGFNHGAYRELTLPFQGVLDFGEIERQARSSVLPGLGDFSSVTRPALTREAEEAPPESKSA